MQRLTPLLMILICLLPNAWAQTDNYTTSEALPPSSKPRIALLLPIDSASLGEAASVLRSGVEAAAAVDHSAELLLLSDESQSMEARYQEAVARGANVVIGPLSRSGIAAVAPYVSLPTIALNSLNADIAPNPKLYSLSLVVEGEARQIAQQMTEDERQSPLIIMGSSALAKRLQHAFSEEWQRLHEGQSPTILPLDDEGLSNTPPTLASADALFFAVDNPQLIANHRAKLHEVLSTEIPLYATSLLNRRTPQPALAGIRIIDMPWFLLPEQASVKRYPRPSSTLTMQTERVYALGIDAWRLALQLVNPETPNTIQLDGVTGEIQLNSERVFERKLPLTILGTGAP